MQGRSLCRRFLARCSVREFPGIRPKFQALVIAISRTRPGPSCLVSDNRVMSKREVPPGRVVDLFCGVGLFSRAFVDVGFTVSGVDIKASCARPYRDLTSADFTRADIGTLGPGFFSGCLRPLVIVGGPPCQPYSQLRRGREYDTRASLVGEFGRLVLEVRPDYVVMEEVPRLLKRVEFSDLVAVLCRAGYQVDYDVVRCEEYGVPQYRRRLVLLAGLGRYVRLPRPTHGVGLLPLVTTRDTIGGLVPVCAGGVDPGDPLHAAAKLSPINLKRIRASRPGGTWRDWPRHLLPECYRRPSGSSYPGVYGRVRWDTPASTVTTQSHNYGSGRHGHPDQDRAFTRREMALLQGFPSKFQFLDCTGGHHPLSVVSTMIGNAVPLALAHALARSVADSIRGGGGICGDDYVFAGDNQVVSPSNDKKYGVIA